MTPLFALFDNILTTKDAQLLFDELELKAPESASVVNWDGTRVTNEEVRRADITSLDEEHWLAQKLFAQIVDINTNLWGFSPSAKERIQIIDYSQKGHYNWHFDVLPAAEAQMYSEWEGSNRILTAILNLSDESEYSMGDLLIHDPASGSRAPGLHGRGTMIVFPSNHWHRATAVTSGFRRVAVMWVRGLTDHPANNYVSSVLAQAETAHPESLDTACRPVGIPAQQGIIVYRPYTNHVYALDPLAGWIWQALAQRIPEPVLIDDLSTHFSKPTVVIEKDIEELKTKWHNESIFPDESARFFPTIKNSASVSSHLYSVSGVLLQIGYGSDRVETMLHPLLAPLTLVDNESAIHQITIEVIENLYYVSIDQGGRGVFQTAERTVLSVLNEIQRLCLESGKATLVFGAGAVENNGGALIMPDLLAPGRTALLVALSKCFNVELLSAAALPFYSASNTIKALPLPVKLRELDISLLATQKIFIETEDCYGTPSDRQFLSPLCNNFQGAGNHYRPKSVLFARYDPQQKTSLTEISPINSLARLMESGSYFVNNPNHRDLLQITNKICSISNHQLSFQNLEEAMDALQPLFA
ncbi:MAG: hypothetical protein HKN85_13015 [Gammaproteobacteria bacterium]|nr:hypothetical protein [Gammaproteobacteria bacterium]